MTTLSDSFSGSVQVSRVKPSRAGGMGSMAGFGLGSRGAKAFRETSSWGGGNIISRLKSPAIVLVNPMAKLAGGRLPDCSRGIELINSNSISSSGRGRGRIFRPPGGFEGRSSSGESTVRSIMLAVRPKKVPSLLESCGGDIRCEFVLLGFLPLRFWGNDPLVWTGESGSAVRSMTGAGCCGCCPCGCGRRSLRRD